tara:strand:+ start:1115 stop:1246 length:132 start_codon:yes stop_codon:yes gene_type:complete
MPFAWCYQLVDKADDQDPNKDAYGRTDAKAGLSGELPMVKLQV